MTSEKEKPLIIVYHGNCIDGAACAWAVAKSRGIDEVSPANVTYIPYEHYAAAKAEEKIRAALAPEAEIFFADVAPKRAFLDELMTPEAGHPKVEAVHILDHHKTEAEALKGYVPPAADGSGPQLEIFIEAEKLSAARMIWEHLLKGEPVPPVFDVINMMDGAATGLKTPEDFAAAALVDTRSISTQERAFKALRGLASATFNDMAQKGREIVADQDEKINRLLANAMTISLQIAPDGPPVKVPLVNGDVKQFGRGVSDRLVALGKEAGSGVAFCWFMQKTGAVTISIRSDGVPDTSVIAEHLKKTMGVTGGGHAGAAAVHFSSLFEFARHMPIQAAAQTPAATQSAPKKDDAGPKTL